VYVPNIFFVKNINVVGVEAEAKANLLNSVSSFLKQKLPWPQQNLILLSKENLKNHILKNNSQIMEVVSIKRDFPNSLEVGVLPRVDQLVLQTKNATYVVSNDGQVTKQLDVYASSSAPNLALLKVDEEKNLAQGQQVMSMEKVNFISIANRSFAKIVNSKSAYFEATNLQTPEITVYFENNVKLFLDLNSDVHDALSRLKLLASNLSDADFSRLFYIDLRYKNKGYLCYKGTPCVADINLLNNASSTPASE